MTEPASPETPPAAPTLKIDPTTRQVMGRDLGGYRIVGEIGRGGMAIVYRGHDPALDRTVAVKVLPAHLQGDEEFAQRFEREARAAARVDHPNVVQVYAAGRSEDVLWIAMQYVEGSPLSDLLRRRRVGLREALELAHQAALGLAAAHKLGIVHRDVKPGNFLVDADGRLRVTDFGLAKAGRTDSGITRTGTFLGTPEYSSPEQCETRELDARSDVYSLGVVLYEMLSGRLPHAAETPLALFKKIVEERPLPIEQLNRDVSQSVRALLARMLEKSPSRRIASAAEVAASLERILATESFPASTEAGALPIPSERMEGVPRAAFRGPLPGFLLVGVVLLTIAVVSAYFGYYAEPGDRDQVDPATTGVSGSAAGDRIVVFDFKNGRPGPDAENHAWLEVGLAEMLIANLGQEPGRDVVIRDDLVLEMQSAAEGKRAFDDASVEQPGRVSLNPRTRELVARLGARWLVSGVFYAQDGLRVIAQLYRREGDRFVSIGSIPASGAEPEVFAVVDELTAQVAARLAGKPAPPRLAPTAVSAPGSAEPPARQQVQTRDWVSGLFSKRSARLGNDGGGGAGAGSGESPSTVSASDLKLEEKKLRDRVEEFTAGIRRGLLEKVKGKEAKTAMDELTRYQARCESKRQIESMTPGDREATRNNLARLESVFDEQVDPEVLLKRVDALFTDLAREREQTAK